MRYYLKVKWDTCPKCRAKRETVIEGFCYRKGRIEKPNGIIGYKCDGCRDFKLAEPSKKVLTNSLI